MPASYCSFVFSLEARSHDPFLRIRLLVPKTGSRRSYSPISRFRFCGENVGRSFVVCSRDPFFRTDKESSIWHQNDHAKFVGAFHLSRRVSDENRACSISFRFFKTTDPFDGRSLLMCSHDPFFGTNKNRILKTGSCERALRVHLILSVNHRPKGGVLILWPSRTSSWSGVLCVAGKNVNFYAKKSNKVAASGRFKYYHA